jgi:hypothetical protein
MADFENNNMNTSNAQNGAQGGAAGNDPYAYQNGYYRNTTPHQDEAVQALPEIPQLLVQHPRRKTTATHM